MDKPASAMELERRFERLATAAMLSVNVGRCGSARRHLFAAERALDELEQALSARDERDDAPMRVPGGAR